MTTNKEVLHAWYSRKQRHVAGLVEYEGLFGAHVFCTEVSSDEHHGSKWDDIVYLGPVNHFVSRIEKSPLDTGEGIMEACIYAFGEEGADLATSIEELRRLYGKDWPL